MGTELEGSNEWMAAASSDNPLDVGIVLDGLSSRHCGHRFRMKELNQYLDGTIYSTTVGKIQQHRQQPSAHNNHHTTTSICPICQAPIVLIEDDGLFGSIAAAQRNDDVRRVLFKYGKHYYRLSLDGPTKHTFWHFNNKQNAGLVQQRIAQVLDMKAMRILCKGKIIYPDVTKSQEEISSMLLSISRTSENSKLNNSIIKSSLVVMGTRIGHELRQRHHKLEFIQWVLSLLYAFIYALLSWGHRLVFRPRTIHNVHED